MSADWHFSPARQARACDPRRGPTVNDIAVLIDRYTGVQASGRFRIYNRETGDMMPGEFSDLSAAMAGAQLAAASDIRALFGPT